MLIRFCNVIVSMAVVVVLCGATTVRQPVMVVENQAAFPVTVSVDNKDASGCYHTMEHCSSAWTVAAHGMNTVPTQRCILASFAKHVFPVNRQCGGDFAAARLTVLVPKGKYAARYHFFMAKSASPWRCSWFVGVHASGALHVASKPAGCVMDKLIVDDAPLSTALMK